MKVKAKFTGFNLVENKVYDVIFEYDTVYEIDTGEGIYCRDKGFFDVVNN